MSRRKACEWLPYITQSPMSHAHIGHHGVPLQLLIPSGRDVHDLGGLLLGQAAPASGPGLGPNRNRAWLDGAAARQEEFTAFSFMARPISWF